MQALDGEQIAAVLIALASGGAMVAGIQYLGQRRREGVARSPGELVFARQDKILADLQGIVAAQSQQLATQGEQINRLQAELAAEREARASEHQAVLDAHRERREMELELAETRDQLTTVRQELAETKAEFRRFKQDISTASCPEAIEQTGQQTGAQQ